VKIGITGSMGFLGGHVADVAEERGHEVVMFDRDRKRGPSRGLNGDREVFLGDVMDDVAMTELAAHTDGVIHLAACLGTQETIKNPRPAAITNVTGGLNFLEACTQYDIPGVYICVGNSGMLNTYSISKTTVEHFTTMFNKERGSRINQVRLVNAVGPRQSTAPPFGCLDPDTPVLKADLTWAPIASLLPGDEIIGIDEDGPGPGSAQRKLRHSKVMDSGPTRKPAVRLEFDDGRSVVCSLDHRWLVSSPEGQLREWRHTKDLRPGFRISSVTSTTWDQGRTFEHGYISGLLDGEAHLARWNVGFTQNPGVVLTEYLTLLRQFGFDPKVRLKEQGTAAMRVEFNGLAENLRLLGEFRPKRLLENAARIWDGMAPKGGRATIVKIIDLGEQDLWDIETSTGTYVANGLASHNSAKVRKVGPAFICRALTETPIEVYGDGNQISDLVHVRDGALALVRALEEAEKGNVFDRPVFIGTKDSHTVNEVARQVVESAVRRGFDPVQIKHLPMRPGETPGAVISADPSTLELVGMDPNDLATMPEIIDETVGWFAENWYPAYRAAHPILDPRTSVAG
jgi:nucleoside-diphosphate-sugar epimerase